MARRSGWAVVGVTFGFVAVFMLAVAPSATAQSDAFGLFGDSFAKTRALIFDGLANQVGTLPNPSGGGFTYTFDPSLGVFSRTTESFGPVFANRAETTGRGKFTLSTSFSRHTFDKADGVDLRSGEITPAFGVPVFPPFAPAPGVFLVDVISLREEVQADVFTIGFLYGITDQIDVGITLPILNVKVKERPRELGFILCDLAITTCPVVVPTGIDFRSNTAEATGIGDVVLRGKYNFLQRANVGGGRVGVAFALDVKLPTGDEGDRAAFTDSRRFASNVDFTLADVSTQQFGLGDPPLGTGIVRVRPQLVASGSWAGFAPHINVGAELGTTEGITNDLIFEFGADYTVAQRVTFSADILGRYAFDVERTRVTALPFDPDASKKARRETITASLGVKANPIGTLLVFFNVLIPIGNTGIRDNLTPTAGLEWSF